MTENVVEIAARLRSVLAEIDKTAERLTRRPDLHQTLEVALLESHSILSRIISAQDIQELYRAQDAARVKLQKMRESRV